VLCASYQFSDFLKHCASAGRHRNDTLTRETTPGVCWAFFFWRENGREETEDVGAGVDCRVLGVRAAEVPVRAFPDSRVCTRRACVRA
jgi:hypothetical protein